MSQTGVMMFSTDIVENNVVLIRCGEQWSEEDSRMAAQMGSTYGGRILVVDMSLLRLENGYTVVNFAAGLPFAALILVCGTLENRIKLELFVRLTAPPCPFIPVMEFEDVAEVVTGLTSNLNVGVIQ